MMTHDEAVTALTELGFEWSEQSGHTVAEPSERCLTYQPGCCHGWIEIRGGLGLVGDVEMRIDGWDDFCLRFPSLADLVEHFAPPTGEETTP